METPQTGAHLQVDGLDHFRSFHGLSGVENVLLRATTVAADSLASNLEGQLVGQGFDASAIDGLHLCIFEACSLGRDLQEGATVPEMEDSIVLLIADVTVTTDDLPFRGKPACPKIRSKALICLTKLLFRICVTDGQLLSYGKGQLQAFSRAPK